jgi:hypothetical protein
MKNQPKLLAVLTAAALSAGCASGGGSGGGGNPVVVDTAEEQFLCMLMPLFCLFGNDAGSPSARASSTSGAAEVQGDIYAAPPPPFTSWSATPAGKTVWPGNLQTSVSYIGYGEIRSTSVSTGSQFWEGNEGVKYDPQGNFLLLGSLGYSFAGTTLGAIGQPAIGVRQSEYTSALTSFANSPGGPTLGANPYALGWEYQSFGVWEDQGSAGSGRILASTFGAPTPASAVPTTGSATFSGKLAGFYVSPAGQGSMAAAELSVNANFNTRSLSLSSTGTALTRDARTATSAPSLNLPGTLTYAPNTNSFGGTLVNSGGTMSGASQGRFYGPAAQELGGVFTVKSPTTVETFTGAYGAKR